LPRRKCRGFARPGSFSNNVHLSSANGNAHLRDVNCPVTAAPSLSPDAATADGSAVPSFVSKDAIGLRDYMPAFDIAQPGAVGAPRPYVPRIEFRLKQPDLIVRECHYFVLTINTGWGLLSLAPGTLEPRLSSPRRAGRLNFGG